MIRLLHSKKLSQSGQHLLIFKKREQLHIIYRQSSIRVINNVNKMSVLKNNL